MRIVWTGKLSPALLTLLRGVLSVYVEVLEKSIADWPEILSAAAVPHHARTRNRLSQWLANLEQDGEDIRSFVDVALIPYPFDADSDPPPETHHRIQLQDDLREVALKGMEISIGKGPEPFNTYKVLLHAIDYHSHSTVEP